MVWFRLVRWSWYCRAGRYERRRGRKSSRRQQFQKCAVHSEFTSNTLVSLFGAINCVVHLKMRVTCNAQFSLVCMAMRFCVGLNGTKDKDCGLKWARYKCNNINQESALSSVSFRNHLNCCKQRSIMWIEERKKTVSANYSVGKVIQVQSNQSRKQRKKPSKNFWKLIDHMFVKVYKHSRLHKCRSTFYKFHPHAKCILNILEAKKTEFQHIQAWMPIENRRKLSNDL